MKDDVLNVFVVMSLSILAGILIGWSVSKMRISDLCERENVFVVKNQQYTCEATGKWAK